MEEITRPLSREHSPQKDWGGGGRWGAKGGTSWCRIQGLVAHPKTLGLCSHNAPRSSQKRTDALWDQAIE